MIFYTEFSKYEIDLDARKIRRLEGAAPPTERQGKDGEWRKYYEILGLCEGCCPVIQWEEGSHKGTHLSQVMFIEKESA